MSEQQPLMTCSGNKNNNASFFPGPHLMANVSFRTRRSDEQIAANMQAQSKCPTFPQGCNASQRVQPSLTPPVETALQATAFAGVALGRLPKSSQDGKAYRPAQSSRF